MSMERAHQCLVVGAGGHARVVLGILQELANSALYTVCGIIDLHEACAGETILGVPVIGSMRDLESDGLREVQTLFLAIGDNAERRRFQEYGRSLGYKFPNLISESAGVSTSAVLGEGNVICPFAHIGPDAVIGDGNLINTRAVLEHESALAGYCHLAPGSIVCGRSKLGDSVMLGASATVINSLEVAEGTTVGAGGVVVQSILSPSSVYVGIPARSKEGT